VGRAITMTEPKILWLLARLLPLPQAEAGSRGSLTPCPCWLLLLPSSPRTKHQEILDVDEEAR